MQSIHVVAAAGGIGDGIVPWLVAFFSNIENVVKAFCTVLALCFVAYKWIESRFSTTALLTCGVMAGVFLWIIWNIDVLKDGVDNDTNGKTTAAMVQVVEVEGPPSPVEFRG